MQRTVEAEVANYLRLGRKFVSVSLCCSKSEICTSSSYRPNMQDLDISGLEARVRNILSGSGPTSALYNSYVTLHCD